jgi:HlyD family secretion protein
VDHRRGPVAAHRSQNRQSGDVHEFAAHTVGGAIGTAEPLMLVVPIGETLTVDVRLAPYDIDQATIGQKVILRFTALNQRTTPELLGTVVLRPAFRARH